jgi:transglutaminase-like putative cysteine protease
VRFEIAYETEYVYPKPIADSINAVRVKPAINQGQALESFALRVSPDARVHERRDYFGTDVLEFGIDEPHERLSVKASAGVVTDPLPEPPEGDWESLGEPAYMRTAGEFLLLDPTASGPEDKISELLGAIAERSSPLATAQAIASAIPDRFTYSQDATFVGSTVDDLLEGGAGVCQDFVHLALILFRRLGFGARYVSGYLFAAAKDGGTDSVEVQTHAWLEALMPNGGGESRWIGFDPTNAKLAGETHVKIGHGRNYQDVPPIRGVYRGPPVSDLHTSVKMTRVNSSA